LLRYTPQNIRYTQMLAEIIFSNLLEDKDSFKTLKIFYN